MSSYSFDTEYGTDQISVGSDDIRDYLNSNDSNDLHQINAIRDREVRLLKKINQYSPTCEQNNRNIDPCNPSVYAKNVIYKEQHRVNEYPPSICKTYPKKRLPKKSTVSVKEGFQIDDVKYLQGEVETLEKKNDMLVLLIFFLVIVVLIQYAKGNNDNKPMQLMFLPSGSSLQTTGGSVQIQ